MCMGLPRYPPATVRRREAFVAEMQQEQGQIQGPASDQLHARQHRSRGVCYGSHQGSLTIDWNLAMLLATQGAGDAGPTYMAFSGPDTYTVTSFKRSSHSVGMQQ